MVRLLPALVVFAQLCTGCSSALDSKALQFTQTLPTTGLHPTPKTNDSNNIIVNPNLNPNHIGLAAGTVTNRVSDGYVRFDVDINNQINALATTLIVPPEPPAGTGTLFLVALMQPGGGGNYQALGIGGLQPVLTWGPSCAPNQNSNDQLYQYWWFPRSM